ncbi:DNRLRE domain-containing protein [Streptomyces sp. NPDC005761]|uniref:DNRLRE domain-containing protein n=1 Tax=Streptomyces sp. NPDC005761 TaxID=3157066 RepID=UPI0033FCCC25
MALATAALLAVEAASVLDVTGQAVALSSQRPSAAGGKSYPTEAADLASARLAARLSGKRMEALSERTELLTTWANPDGTVTTDAASGPVRFRDKTTGAWRNIDVDLVKAVDGSVVAKDHPLGLKLGGKTPVAKAARVMSSGAAGAAGTTPVPLVSLDAGDGRTLDLSWRGVLPEPSVSGHTARYANTLTATDLIIESTRTGFEQFLELKDRSAVDANGSVTLTLNAKGIEARANADQSVTFLDTESGKQVGNLPAPVMWDAYVDPNSGEHTRQADVRLKVTQNSDAIDLTLTPDAKFLTDPARTFPVTVDPAVNIGASFDTFVQQGYDIDTSAQTELKLGNNGSGQIARSFLTFPMKAITGKQILSAKLNLWNSHSWSCTATGWEVWDTPAVSTATRWTNQPGFTNKWATSTATKGFSSSCADGWVSQDIQSLAAAWAANGNGTNTLGIKATTESGTNAEFGWKRFNSGNAASNTPYVSVTYNTAPVAGNPMSVTPGRANAGKNWVTTTIPDMGYTTSDAETTLLRSKWELWEGSTNLEVYDSGTQDPVTNKKVSHQAPSGKLVNGRTYWFKGRVNDGNAWSNWTPSVYFTVDTTKPATSTVASGDFPANTWSGTPDTDGKHSGSFTLTPPATDVAEVQYKLDSGAWASTATTGTAVTKTLTFPAGKHTVTARTVDPAGNVSTETTHVFYAGSGAAMLSPRDGDRPARRVTLAAEGLTSYTGVTYQFRRGETDAWKNLPAADVRQGTNTLSAWPVSVTGGKPATMTWNITDSLTEDGPIEVRAAFTDGTTTGYSQTAEATLDRDAGTALTNQVGPGQVNELTGDFSLSATDATAFAASVNRTFSSRTNSTDTEGQAQIFGPGWTSAVSAESSDYTQIRETSGSSVEVLTGDGSTTAFTKKSSGGWQPEIGAESLTLTYSTTTNKFTLTDTDANTVVFAKADPISTTWTVFSSASAVDDSTVTVFSTTVDVGGKKLARPRYVVSPTGAATATTCQTTPSTKGCRVLEYVYATATTATPSALGDYVNQVSAVKLWATTHGASASTSETLASYAYNASGQLRQVWDPRISPSLKTEYAYGTDGRVATYTKPGELPWAFTYGTAGSTLTSGPGMLLKVSRAALAAGSASTTSGTATTTVVYDVPVSGPAAPYQMDAATVAAWGQSEAPTDATAFFPADSVPASSTGNGLTADVYARATISYINANGSETNTVSPGGAITTTEYDLLGNQSSDLTAGNRELALGTSANATTELAALGLTDRSTAERAQQLSTVLEYTADGTRVTDEYGPLHQITLAEKLTGTTTEATLAAGTVIPSRSHTSYTYDEGAPANAEVSDLVTSSTTGAAIAGYATDAEAKTTTTTYDWSTGSELATTTGGESAGHVTSYDSAGRVATTRTPKSAGSDAGTLVHTYYDAHATGACTSAEWDGLLCKTAPAAAISGGGTNPAEAVTTVYTYGRWGQVVTKAETANGVTRTTTTTADAAGSPTGTTITGGTGTGTPATTITYDGATGQVASTTANGKTSTSKYDALGRTHTYSDGSGSTSSFTYDILDRPVAASDSVPSTTTYTYDATTGQARSITDSVAGTFTAGAHDPDGALTKETLPGGYARATTYDPTGNQTSVTYTDSSGTTVLSDSAAYTIHGKQTGHTQTDGGTLSTAYDYDASGRLARATDDDGTTTTSRAYAFDTDDNRTSLTTTVTAAGSTPSTSSTAYAYDTAGRLIAGGYTYDAFGRTTQVAEKTLAYYTNDLVAGETVGSARTTWGLDASGRLASSATATTSDSGATWSTTSTTLNHYNCGCDTPSWTVTTAGSASTVSRNVPDLSGGLAVTTDGTGAAVLQLANLHGDISVRLDLATSAVTVQHYDEYGIPLDATAAAAKYGSLGAYQRATDRLAGYTLMGVRVYDPTIGRFLQNDPVYGGNTSAYIYPADPIGQSDTSGELNYRYQTKKTKNYTIGLQRSCTGKSKCSLTWYVKLKSIWKKYGALKFVYNIVLPLYKARKNQDYGHLEPGTYVFHGSWGVPNGRSRPESDRGKYRALGMTFWFDWTDNVEFSGKFTVMNICVKNPILNVYGLFT